MADWTPEREDRLWAQCHRFRDFAPPLNGDEKRGVDLVDAIDEIRRLRATVERLELWIADVDSPETQRELSQIDGLIDAGDYPAAQAAIAAFNTKRPELGLSPHIIQRQTVLAFRERAWDAMHEFIETPLSTIDPLLCSPPPATVPAEER